MLSMLIAYDAAGDIVATLDHLVVYDEGGNPVGLTDFAAHECSGGELTDIWQVANAVGSATWPEWLGAAAHDFTAEFEPGWSLSTPPAARPPYRVRALVHRTSGHRRERATISATIDDRIRAAAGDVADIRDLVGGPGRPLRLEADGRSAQWRPMVAAPALPFIHSDENARNGSDEHQDP